MIDISVVIPVYNVELHIERCVESIVNQHFSGNFEVILVDDGSTDNSYSILLSLEQKYGREIIKIFQHDKNMKLSQARKTGFLKSCGKYIWNVDSDDWIENGAMQELYNITRENDVDLVLFNAQYHDGIVGSVMDKSCIESKVYSKESFDKFQDYFKGAIWRKLIKRSILDENYELFKVSINSGEDYLYGLELLSRARNLYFTNKVYYNYFYNIDSITKTVSQLDLLCNSVFLYDVVVRIMKKYDLKVFKYFSESIYWSYIFRLFILKLNSKEFSRIFMDVIDKTSSSINEMLLITSSKFYINKGDLKIMKLLKKNIEYYGLITVVKKTTSYLINKITTDRLKNKAQKR